LINAGDHFASLRDAIRELNAAGADGFEGLIAAVLSDITKTAFALASSGSQRGKDGNSSLNNAAVAFEAMTCPYSR